ncbi:MAG: LytTR family transcriptional regulator DNA-binding domain-containing protein [Bacteroidales bacterium]|jgi:two-component system LytT family response regulator
MKNEVKVLVNSAKEFKIINKDELLYLLATKNCTEIHLINERKPSSSKSLKECCELLQMDNLYRVCNSFAVNLMTVEKYDKYNKEIIFVTGEKLIIPCRQVSEFQKIMKEKFINL